MSLPVVLSHRASRSAGPKHQRSRRAAALALLLAAGGSCFAFAPGRAPARSPAEWGSRPQFSSSSVRDSSSVRRGAWENFEDFCTDPVVSVLGWSFVAFSLTILRVAVAEENDTPRAFLERQLGKERLPREHQPVVCLGDSLTRGNLSADWVADLRQRLTDNHREEEGQPAVINAGVNMQCVKNVLGRLDEVTACKPSHVTVLVGTNDLKAMGSSFEGWLYRVFGNIKKVPTVEEYERDLVEIRDRLVASGANVALVSPPVLGEDINCEANVRAAAFAEIVKRVAKEGGSHCSYLPLFEETSADLPSDGGRPYDGFRFFWWLCLLCFDMHVFKRDLAEVQRERNLGVTLDLVHLGPRAANTLADMTASFIAANPVRTAAAV